MSDEPRGCFEIIKWWLFAPCLTTTRRVYEPRVTARVPVAAAFAQKTVFPEGERSTCQTQKRDTTRSTTTSRGPTSPPRAAPRPPPRSESKGKLQKQHRKAATAEEADMGWIDWNFLSGKRERRVARRPRISTPSNFQHIGSGAINFRSSVPDGPPDRTRVPAPPAQHLQP
ncbi:hypothetical protein OPQ81_003776 [Rhizoctonia solani]|nr:hypothetical protein OPQ81_003776 [Rhizoctonia solani]